MTDRRRQNLVKGTLNLLVLRTLSVADGPQHGWNIAKLIEHRSDGVVTVTQGSLYPALHRLEAEGWIEGVWRTSELGRRARFYRLTRRGRAKLERETASWIEMAEAMRRALSAENG